MWLPDTSLPGTVTSERSGGAVSLASSALHWTARTLSFMLARIVQVHAPPTAVHRVQTAIHIHMKCQLGKELQPSSQTSWWTFSLFINSSTFLCWESQNWTHYSLCVSWEQSRGAVSPPLTCWSRFFWGSPGYRRHPAGSRPASFSSVPPSLFQQVCALSFCSPACTDSRYCHNPGATSCTALLQNHSP